MKSLLLFLAVTYLWGVPFCRADLLTHVTAEGGVVHYDIGHNAANGTYAEPGSQYVFGLGFKQGERGGPKPVIVATISRVDGEHFSGKSSLQLQIIARDELASKRAAYKVCINSVDAPDKFAPPIARPGDWYHGFAMKIDPTYFKLPENDELVFEQWWQGSPFHPPVALVAVARAEAIAKGWSDAGPDGNFALALRDDTHDPGNHLPGNASYYDLGPVKTGEWMTWVVQVRPSPVEPKGRVVVTVDGKERLKLENVRVGYDPANPIYGVQKPAKRFACVNVCLYRLNGQNYQRFFFDEVKFATTYGEALPAK